MKVKTTYPHPLIKLTQITEYTLDEKAFFIEECEGREVWSTVEGIYQRIIEIKDYASTRTECKTTNNSKNGITFSNLSSTK
tara:strand:- start:693 stop:935 length:243 start_codon:yes stop_codon:yes gene_type:complete